MNGGDMIMIIQARFEKNDEYNDKQFNEEPVLWGGHLNWGPVEWGAT